MKPYDIGIDPGKNTGFAVYSREERELIEVLTIDFWRVIDILTTRFQPRFVNKVIIEIPRTKHIWHKANSKGATERTAVNVGSVIREAELLCEWLELKGYKYFRQHPQGKLDQARFAIYTGWGKRTSEHARDAGMLVYQS